MDRIPRPTNLMTAVVALLLIIAWPSARAGELPPPISKNPTIYFACMTAVGKVEYDSAAFATRNPGPTYADLEKLVSAIQRDFEAYLKQKYGYGGFSQCGQHDTLAQAKQWLAGRKEYQVGRNYELVVTDWTYGGGRSEAAEPPTPKPEATANAGAPAAPASRTQTAFFACISATSELEYDSAVFESDTSTANARSMRFAYAAYLEEKYNFRGAATCMPRPTREAAQKYLLENTPAARGMAAKRISTGWVYNPHASAATQPATTPTQVATATSAPKPVAPPAAAPKPAAPAASTKPNSPAASGAPANEFVVCKADREPPRRYFNPPINGGSGSYEVWQASYKAFMQQNYRYRRTVACNKFPTLAESQAYYQKMLEQARTGNPSPIVITHWKYP